MYSHRQVAVWILVLAAVATAPATQVAAQQSPTVVVSIASVDRLMDNVGYLTRAAGMPEIGGLAQMMAGQYVEGLDTKRPAGLFVDLSGGEPSGVGFLPVANFGTILAKIEEQIGEPDDVGDGIYKISLQRDIFFRERGGWVLISDSAANLANAPQDPSRALGDLPSKYEIAVQLNVQNIPAPLRQMAVDGLREGFERGLSGELESDEREFQSQFGRHGIDNLVSFIEDSERVMIGWGVDRNEGATFFDVEVSAKPGSKLAKRFALATGGKTNFAGFMNPDSVAHLHFTSAVSSDDLEQAKMALGLMRKKVFAEIDEDDDLSDDATRTKAKDAVGALLKVIDDTVAGGKFDGGASLYLNDGTVQFVAGGLISNGHELEDALKQLVELAKTIEDDPNLNRIVFDAESYKGVDFHTLTVPIPANENEARKMLGAELPIAVGTAGKAVYFAAGQGSTGILKSLIDRSASQGEAMAAPMTFDLALGPILGFAASVEDEVAIKMMADTLRAGKDHISITAKSVPQGVSYRIQIQEGVLQLIGVAAKLQGGQGNN